MTSSSSLYGSSTTTGTVASGNYTTLYSSGTGTVPNNNLVVPGTLTVNGCAILTNCTTFDLLPTTATTINFGSAATALNLGAATGVTLINNQLATANYAFPVADGLAGQVLVTDGSGTLSFAAASSVGKDYDISATTTTGGANLNLNSNLPTTDTVKFADGTNMSVVATDANTITIGTLSNVSFTDITLNGEIIKTSGSPSGVLTIDRSIALADDGWELKLTNPTTSTPKYPLVVVGEVTGSGTTLNGGGAGIRYSVDLGPLVDPAIGTTELQVVDIATDKYDFVVKIVNNPLAPAFENFRITNSAEAITGRYTTYVNNTATAIGVGGGMAGNDYWNIGGYSISGSASNDGALEIATANNGNEPIYVRQYSGGSTSGSTWPWGNTILRTLTLLDASGNTALPGTLTLTGSTSGSTTFSVPATGSTLTYVLPSTAGAANTVLTNDGAGNLSWALPGGGGSTFGNVSIGVVTDNTISTTSGDLDITSATGVVNIDTYTTLTDNRLTTTSTSTVTLDSFAVATYQNATYFINVKDNVTGDIQSTRVDIMHNGTTAYINQYANMYTTADLSTFAATISGANVLLEITPASANSTQFTFSRTALKV